MQTTPPPASSKNFTENTFYNSDGSISDPLGRRRPKWWHKCRAHELALWNTNPENQVLCSSISRCVCLTATRPVVVLRGQIVISKCESEARNSTASATALIAAHSVRSGMEIYLYDRWKRFGCCTMAEYQHSIAIAWHKHHRTESHWHDTALGVDLLRWSCVCRL